MRASVLCATAATCTIAVAQPGVLTSAEMPPVGTTLTYRTVENLAVIDTSSGTNVTWDMSTILPTTQTPWDVDYMAPTSSPHPTAFPTSNYCYFESEIPRYNYYDLNATTMERVGSWATGQSTYTDRQVELVFPLQLGTVNSDTWDNTVSSFGGTYDIACIGSGSLQLPMGTFNDVLLVRVTLFEIFELVNYQWIDATNGAPLLIHYPGDGFWVPTAAAYLVDASIGIPEMPRSTDLRVQGLIDGRLMVSYASPGPLTLLLRSATGQLVRTVRWPASAAPSTRALEVQDLSNGVYVLQVQGDDAGQRSERFVKP